jgi:diaminopimelate decarboxylase
MAPFTPNTAWRFPNSTSAGACNHSMASNYNLVERPPVVAARDRAARLLVRREMACDMRQRDVGL